MPGTVYLVGAGPGDPGLMTQKGLDCLRRADCVVYDHLANDSLLLETKPDCEKIYVGKQAGNHTMPQEEINRLLAQKAQSCETVVRLKGGDVYVFGRGGEEGAWLRREGVPFVVVPGVTSAIAGLAYAGIPITHRGVARGFRVMTAHDKGGGLTNLDFDSMAHTDDTLVFLMGLSLLGEITSRLLAAGKPSGTPAAVISEATLPTQRVVTAPLSELEACVRENPLPSPALIVVGEVVRERETLRFFGEGPLGGVRVLLPCVGETPSRLGGMLRGRGAFVTELPVRRIRELPGVLRRHDVEWAETLVLTSRHACAFFFGQLFALGLDVRALSGMRIAAVGPGTAEELSRFGLRADLVPEPHTGEGMEALLRRELTPGTHVLYPKVKELAPELAAALASFCELRAPELYENLPVEDAVLSADASFDAAVFTSASAVRGALGALRESGVSVSSCGRLISIGPKTARELRQNGFDTLEAAHADLGGILEKMEELFHE